MKYNQTVNDLKKIILATANFKRTKSFVLTKKILPTKKTTLLSDAKDVRKTLGKTLSSEVQIVSTYSDVLTIPTHFSYGATEYYISHKTKNIHKLLYLLGNENAQLKAIRNILGIKETTDESIIIHEKSAVYQYEIFDYKHTNSETAILYSLNQKLKTGQKYLLDYEVATHPNADNKVVFLLKYIQSIEQDTVNFSLTKDDQKALKVFQTNNVPEKMLTFYEDGKKYIGNFISKDVYYMTELIFHSVLQLKYNNQIIRGALDGLMIGETRTGKSQTVKYLLDLYEKGTILSLKNTTEKGLIGGSSQASGKGQSWKLSIGALTQQHRGFVALEELQGCDYDPHQAMTDMRSSGVVRLTRVGASLIVPTINRRISLSNPKGAQLSIKQYSSGLPIIEALVPKREDIARYDLICIVNAFEHLIKPLPQHRTTPNYPKPYYLARLNWIWSRTPEQIEITKAGQKLLWERTVALSDKFESTIQIIGRETNLKLIRVATAVAGMVCSTDENFEKIIVDEQHVNWAADFMDYLYSSPNFKLDIYVKKQKEIINMQPQDIEEFNNLYQVQANQDLLNGLANIDTFVNTKTISLWSEYDTTQLNILIKKLLKLKFIVSYRNDYIVTLRYKTVYNQVIKKKAND